MRLKSLVATNSSIWTPIQVHRMEQNFSKSSKQYIISKILLTTLCYQMQSTWRYLNRHLQDFSVVLAGVRGNIRQVKISLQFHLEPSYARLRMRTGGSSVGFFSASFVRGQIPSFELISQACWKILCLPWRPRWRVPCALPWELCCGHTQMCATPSLCSRLAFAFLPRLVVIPRSSFCPSLLSHCSWTHRFPAL